ncbi:hypothetical protein BDA96_09G250500 [Sorghum bicolor]|uniref:Uncharacterized protein n=2 Tax=Sorghum bicolor TaxID=4558 RepID=A0A921QF10_SORBI|nr:hypothetical protein BDA96_09G250500 [Sorghum bicolor]OQU78437.1 hypothetical protein SORBI_3009G236950 [Sorghum bicolor]
MTKQQVHRTCHAVFLRFSMPCSVVLPIISKKMQSSSFEYSSHGTVFKVGHLHGEKIPIHFINTTFQLSHNKLALVSSPAEKFS